MPQLHALLVGINDYAPQSYVGSLKGCIKDVNAMQTFLKKNYAHQKPSIKVLKNAQATREKLIKMFRSHLSAKAQAGDTVLFFYSGHGSFGESAPIFKAFDSKGQDETLVCYDSRLPGKEDLADKEIAVLLSEIAKEVNIVLIIDSCHSASISRSVVNEANLPRKRFTSGQEGIRKIENYLLSNNNYYVQQQAEKGTVTIPKTPHVVLAACDRDQEAWESDDERGLFTKTLLGILEKNPNISYNDLFLRIRQVITTEVEDQNPKFEAYENFNHNQVFLSKEVVPNFNRHYLRFADEKWRLDMGAIHGLPVLPEQVKAIQIAIFPPNSNTPIAQGTLQDVLLKESIVEFPKGKKNLRYDAEIINFPLALPVFLEGTPKARKAFLKMYQEHPSPFVYFVEEKSNCKYKLAIEKGQLAIYLCSNQKLIHGRKGTDENAIFYILSILENIEEWERISNLNNKQTRFKPKDVELAFYQESEDRELGPPLKDALLTLDYPAIGADKDKDGEQVILWYQLKAFNHTDQPLYIALLDLDSNFAVKAVYPCARLEKKSETIVDIDSGLGFDAEDTSDGFLNIFKLIVSTEEFDDYSFRKEGFDLGEIAPATKSGLKRKTFKRKPAEADWCTRTIAVHTVRKAKSIGAEDLVFESEKITVKGHSKFKANIGFAPIKTHTKSVNPLAALPEIFRDDDFEILHLGGRTRGTSVDRSIIELSGIENQAALKDNPLEIIIDQELKGAERLIPVTFDGEFVYTFGEVDLVEGKTHILLRDLPLMPDPGRRRKKSVPKALWFALLKFAGFRELAFRLRYVTYDKKGKVQLTDRNIKSKVAGADKILLLVHGIIGGTKTMAKNLRFLLDNKHYDLILTFDYENLNEPLEKTAKELNKALKLVGLGAKDNKHLDIVAHSMGGLVSRQMIETERKGDGLVDRLIMFGTPNGGSAFGSIPQYRDLLSTLLSLSLNFGKAWLGPAYAYLEGLNTFLKATKPVTVTLDQMSTKSDFVARLYSENDPKVKPNTQYIAVAGDIHDYRSITDKRFARFMEKLSLRVGGLVYGDEPNDIAVSVAMIHFIPTPFQTKIFTIIGHHMNYFEEGNGLEELKTVLLEEGKEKLSED